MQNSRPKIKVPFQPVDLIIELTSITILILMIIYTIIEYTNLPETIPTHFNAEGIADDFGSQINCLAFTCNCNCALCWIVYDKQISTSS